MKLTADQAREIRRLNTLGRPRVYGRKPLPARAERRPLTEEERETAERHLDVIDMVVSHRPRSMDPDEARGEAMLALCECLPRYKTEREPDIKKYLFFKIRYMLIDVARRTGGFARCRTGSLDGGEFVQAVRPLSIHVTPGGMEVDPSWVADPGDFRRAVELADWRREFWAVVDRMSPRDRAIIRGTIDGKTLKDIGVELGLSESWVSQARPHVFETLKARLASRGLDDGPGD